jgi:hypothetical protein
VATPKITVYVRKNGDFFAALKAPDLGAVYYLRFYENGRDCVGKCLLYSNYELATKQFCVRVREGSPIVTSNVDETTAIWRRVSTKCRKKISRSKKSTSVTRTTRPKLCIREPAAGEKSGRLGYHPDLNPLLPPTKQQ